MSATTALVPAPLLVIWSLRSNGPAAMRPFTLHRFTPDDGAALSFDLEKRDQVVEHVPESALRVRRARGDDAALLESWIEAPPQLREVLVTDLNFQSSPA